MSILDKLKKFKQELNPRFHPLSHLDSSMKEAYLLGVGLLGMEDEGELNKKELEAFESLHASFKLGEGACGNTLSKLREVSEEAVRNIVDAFKDADAKFVFLLDLYVFARSDGELNPKEKEYIEVLGDLVKITPAEKVVVYHFAEAIKNADYRTARNLLDQARKTRFRLNGDQFTYFFPACDLPPESTSVLKDPEIYIRKATEFPGTRSFAFSPDNRLMAYAFLNSVMARDVKTGDYRQTLKLDGHTNQVNSLVFSPQGKLLASAGGDGNILLWDLEINAEVGRFKGHGAPVNVIGFAADGRSLVSGSNDKTVRVWDVDSRKELNRFEVHDGPITSVAFSNDGNFLACGSCDMLVSVWRVRSAYEHVSLEGHSKNVNSIAISPDGKLLASGGNDGILKLWDLDKMALAKEVNHGEIIRGLGFSPDGKMLASGGIEGKVTFWGARNLFKLYDFFCFFSRFPNGEIKTYGITNLGFSNQGNLIGAASNDKIALWKTAWV